MEHTAALHSHSQQTIEQREASDEVIERTIAGLRTLKLFSWNLWYGGAKINQAPAKQAAVLDAQGADIVFLQECFGNAGAELARAVGMTAAQQDYDNAVLSSAPVRLLSTDTAPYATAAVVESRLGEILAWSVHLDPWDYGPYRAGELPDAAEEIFAQKGERAREAQARAVLAETDRILGELGGMPVIVAGDFNVPSAADWNGTARPHTRWPATARFVEAGYVDAFRAVHPDPAAAPGRTWSQIESLGNEPRDRIDFIYVRGLDIDGADHLGGAADGDDAPHDAGFTEYGGTCRHIPNHADNAFPSDHLAVRATVRLDQERARRKGWAFPKA